MVILASSDGHFLEQARAGLGAEKAVRFVGEAGEGKETVALVSQRRPTLLVVDMALPPAGGLPVVAQVHKGSPKTRVLAIDDRLNEQRVLKLAKAGAYGYMLGEAIPAYLAKAVRVMAAGEVWLSRKLMGKLVEEIERLVQLRAKPGRRRRGIGSRR